MKFYVAKKQKTWAICISFDIKNNDLVLLVDDNKFDDLPRAPRSSI